MIRLFLLYAILIFAKKAPQLIKDLLNIKGEGMGLKGLSIKNKMGEAALVGDKVKKGMNSIEGKAKGAVGGAVGGLLRGKKGERLKAAAAGASKGYAKGKHDAAQNGDTKGIFSGAYKEMGNIASGGKTSFFNKYKDKLQQADDRIVKGLGSKGGHYANPLTAENQIKLNAMKADLTKRYGADKADKMLKQAIEKTERRYGPLNLADEKQWMYLTKGNTWNGQEYVKPGQGSFKGLSDAIDYSGSGSYQGIGVGNAIMNDSYRYSNITASIDKSKSAFEAAYQNFMSQAQAGNARKDPNDTYYKQALKAYGDYADALKEAYDADPNSRIINVNVTGEKTTAATINGASMEEFMANLDGVNTKLSKQVSSLKANTDAAVQKEEIKQKTDDGKK